MTHQEIIKLAREAGIYGTETGVHYFDLIEDFAYLVAAKEREECAKLVEIFDRTFQTGGGIAGSIRSRGNV